MIDTLLLIDSHAIMHRAFHALPLLLSDDKTPTNVIYGYFSMLYRLVVDLKPTYLAAVFDTPKPTFRNKLFKNYQVQRPKADDNFIIQIPLVKEGLRKAGIMFLEKDGFEADDVIGTLAKKLASPTLRVIIVSGDKDIFQLIDDNIYVASPQVGISQIKLYDKEAVKKKMMVSPDKIVDLKALTGDPSDNYPGAHGIGSKTAVRLIEDFGSLEMIYDHLQQIKSEKIRQILIKEKENVFLSKKLAKININVELSVDIKQLKFNGFNKELKAFLEQYQIRSLVQRIFKGDNKINKNEKIKKQNNQISLF